MGLEFHEWTSMFPLADGARLTRLAEDIRRYGQNEPIVLYQGKLLDGRERYRACMLIGIEPKATSLETLLGTSVSEREALYWMVHKNISERHLTRSQLAVIALELLERSDYKPPYSTEQLKKVADSISASWSSLERLVAIKKRPPGQALIEEVRSGAKSISQASRDAGFIEYDAPLRGQEDYMFGKGDKFREATEPLRRYLNGWRGRGFEFRHLNPKEATQRLRVIDALLDGLTEARSDIADRAEKPQLTHVRRYR